MAKNIKENKPWYTKWWAILLYIFVGLYILGAITGNNESATTSKINVPQTTNTNYIIEVSGTSGLEFSGSIGGAGNSRSVDGVIPATYEVKGWPAVAVIQKKQTSGTLTVTISKNGKILNSQTTDAQYGVVSVSSN